MLEEMIAAEREKDPDALDEEIIQKVQKELTKRKLKGENPLDETQVTQTSSKRKAPAIGLTTLMATSLQQKIATTTADDGWK